MPKAAYSLCNLSVIRGVRGSPTSKESHEPSSTPRRHPNHRGAGGHGLPDARTPQPQRAATAATTSSVIDYNGDGYDDAAVGDPYATVNGQCQAGAVTVLFGDADGRIGEGARRSSPRPTSVTPRRRATGSATSVALGRARSGAQVCWSAHPART